MELRDDLRGSALWCGKRLRRLTILGPPFVSLATLRL